MNSTLQDATDHIEANYGLAKCGKVITHTTVGPGKSMWKYSCTNCTDFDIAVTRRQPKSGQIFLVCLVSTTHAAQCPSTIKIVKVVPTPTPRPITESKDWTTDANRNIMREAMAEVVKGDLSQRAIAKKYGMAQSSLSKILHEKMVIDRKRGAQLAVGESTELLIKDYCLQLADSGYGLNRER